MFVMLLVLNFSITQFVFTTKLTVTNPGECGVLKYTHVSWFLFGKSLI